jgi:threonine dehydrogenase-like Zn-dependent dehydrogenase
MKALRVTAPGKSEVLDVPIPAPNAGQVLVKVEAVTTCPQWDLHLKHNNPMFVGHQFHYPYTLGQPGHEATGYIASVGNDVTNVIEGDRVSIWRDPGHNIDGCYAQYVVAQAENVIHVPDNLPLSATAPVELAMCVGASYLVMNDMNVIKDKVIAVVGLGPAGLIAVQMANAEGAAKVIGFDLEADRRDLALTIGADEVYDSRDALHDTFPTRPEIPVIDSGIDCVGAKVSVEFLMDITQDVVALFGVQREPYTYDIRHRRGLRLCGYPGHSYEAAEYAVDLIKQGSLDLTPLVTHEMPLEKYEEAIDLLEKRQAIKVCFKPWLD